MSVDSTARRTTAQRELGAAMLRLKEASGKSYESLGRRSLMSASTLHRYCRGEIAVPTTDALERFVRACGATPDQLAELRELWSAAVEARRAPEPTPEPEPAPPDRPTWRSRWPVAAVMVTMLAGSQAPPMPAPVSAPGMDIWTLGTALEVNRRQCPVDAVTCTPPRPLGSGPVRAAPAAVRCQGRTYVFTVAADGRLRAWMDGTSHDLGGDLRTGVAATCYGPQVQVFGQDTKGRLRQFWYDGADGLWHRDVDFGPVASAPAVTGFGGQLQVFAAGTDGHLRQWWFDNAYGIWHYGDDRGGRLASAPTAISIEGRLHVFGRGADGNLRQWWYDGSTGIWRHDIDLGLPIRSAPAAVAYNGEILVLAAGEDGRLRAVRFNRSWQSATDLGGTVDAAPAAVRVGNRVLVFAAQRDGSLARWTYDGVRAAWEGPVVAGRDAWSVPAGL
ncbi:helix-turn-helix domain-containing protein [Actinoplanes sp. LDG1-06]|uniref:Helix-turn-helix domain-containing protein n=1 Tax=Paractinoplanes ovalisporus TaxID=2810368 RepID=A0ABS2ALI2_9ACTN|nr:helix-turn-helix domain-containing protein [Actinoplanes ovalisporus]MBM2620709.1 helix-turn-helix domain-containing protein [Actinoplanes ovalisporus]